MKIAALALTTALIAAGCPAAAQDAHTLSLDLDLGARSGRVMVALFDSEAAYAGRGAPVRQAMVDAAADPVAVFQGLPAGDYAARLFHDVNSDGRMNTNPFGLPTEPFAFTNNAVGNMGPATWDRARVSVNADVTQTIALR